MNVKKLRTNGNNPHQQQGEKKKNKKTKKTHAVGKQQVIFQLTINCLKPTTMKSKCQQQVNKKKTCPSYI